MSVINKSESITLKYQGNKIRIVGNTIKAVLEINSGELKKMYFGRTGSATLHIQLNDKK